MYKMIGTWWYVSSEQVGNALIEPSHVLIQWEIWTPDLSQVPWTHMSQPQAASSEMQPFWLISTQARLKDVVSRKNCKTMVPSSDYATEL